ncbi:hypothetical protein ACJX0J_007246, partial [Zea mays]
EIVKASELAYVPENTFYTFEIVEERRDRIGDQLKMSLVTHKTVDKTVDLT